MFKFWNENESFDMTTSHDFVPSEALIKEAVECSQTMTIYEDVEDVTEIGPLTKAMRECKHNRLWNFSKGCSFMNQFALLYRRFSVQLQRYE